MVQVKKYQLPPTDLVPNSPHPVLHYPAFLLNTTTTSSNHHHHQPTTEPAHLRLYDLFARNGWETQWIYRYGPTQPSHYHARTHEAMAVLSGTATIRFGAADRLDDADGDDHDHVTTTNSPDGYAGVEVRAEPGDVFVLPAGTAHKTFATAGDDDSDGGGGGGDGDGGGFALLTPGDGRGIATRDGEDARAALARVRVSGFAMMGAYPAGGPAWDFAVGGTTPREAYGEVWAVPAPRRDPVLGEAAEGVCGQWK